MQFGVVVREFLRFCELERQLSAHTVAAYAADLGDFGKWLAADLARGEGEIGAAVLTNYLEDMVGQRKLAVATVRRRFACLRAFFRRAAKRGECTDPFAQWHPVLPRRKRLPRALSRNEAAFLLSCGGTAGRFVGELPFGTILRLMVATGMRVGELCKLGLHDLSPDCGVVRIHGKGARERVAYITDPGLRRDLQGIVTERRRAGLNGGALFLNRHAAPLRPQSVRSKLRRLAKEAGIDRRVTPHMLRHTAATLLIETGVDIRFVQRLLGHSSIATTEIYTHVSDQALRATLERADVLGTLSAL